MYLSTLIELSIVWVYKIIMYRPKYRTPKSPRDTHFWNYASRLRQLGFRHSVHALAHVSPEAYGYVVDSILSDVSLELIMSGLYQHYADSLNQMKVNGLGSLSPNSLLTFRRELEQRYYPDVSVELNQKHQQLNQLIENANRMDKFHQKISDIEERVGIPTHLGHELIKKGMELNLEISKLQQQLALAK